MNIPVSHGHLEALIKVPDGPLRGAAVMCHPHPVHGGTMHTKAVYRAAQALVAAGIVTLRFNFRGVGTSTGSFDDGIGEQDDARDALDYLAAEYPHLPIVIGGFSFGSRVALSVGVEDDRVSAMLGLGLPVDLDNYDYSFLEDVGKPILIVQGEEDQFGSGPRVASVVAEYGSHITLVRIPAADHFFVGGQEELQSTVQGYFESGPGGRTLLSL